MDLHLVVTGSKTSKTHLAMEVVPPYIRSLCGLKMSHEMRDYAREDASRIWGICKNCEEKERAIS